MEDGLPAIRTWNAGFVSQRAGYGRGRSRASIAPAVVAASCSVMANLIAATQLCVGHNIYLRVGVVAV
jgi:hypothetical protein